MTAPGRIDRRGLLNWADSIGARSELPRLIRRLILETGEGVVALGFPAGEGVSTGSWDGTVRASQDTPYVPAGLSLWELSVEKSVGTKAESDFAKRTATPDGSPTEDCVYVAVSLRPWTKRGDWAKDKRADGRWKDVRALGVDDIETWLESAPVTHAWLSEVVGLKPYGLITAQTWWDRWSSATTPPFPPDAILAGRDEAVSALRSALAQRGELLTIRGSSLDEVAAFVASLALVEETTDGGALLARAAFVDYVEAWRRLREHPSPLVLVALTEAIAAEFLPGSAHVLVVPVTGTSDADIELPPIDSLNAAQVLKDAGLPEKKADDAGKLSRLSLLAARRRLANKRELLQPDWAKPPISRTVRRVMLLGRWNENSDADRGVVEKATTIDYDDLREEVAALLAGGDPFLARLGGTIGVVSHVDAFLVLRGELRKDDLEALHQEVRDVFAETDPRLELPTEDRWRASLLGKTQLYSSDLRQGLATTLALLGAYGDRTIDGAGMAGRDWGAWMVREVLEAANSDESSLLWASLGDVLPLMAEAAPSQFLEAVRAGTTGDSPVLRGIFGDAGGDALSTDSAHSNLLWAMETCAWSPDHFGLVVDLLARLAEIDPGGRLANRPFASLLAILLPWLPQNSVSSERRLDAIDGLRDHHESVAWRLLLALLPEGHSSSMNISEPHFRDWKPESITVPIVEYWNFIDELYKRTLADVERDPDRWQPLLDKIDDIPPASRAATLARLDEISAEDGLSLERRNAIWERLRDKVARHREFADAKWALPEAEVAAIERTAARFEPSEPLDRRGWLFKDQRPDIPDVKRGDNFEEYGAALAELRAEAANEIADSVDWDRILTFAQELEAPWSLGEALARAKRYEHENNFLLLLDSENTADATFAAGYVWKRFRDNGWDWIDGHIAGGTLPATQIAWLLLYSGDCPKAWEVAEGLDETVAEAFWRNFRTHGLGGDFEHVDFVAERLLCAALPGRALDLIALYGRREGLSIHRANLVARGLGALLEADDRENELRRLGHYELTELFAALEASEFPRDRLARLEWAYLPAFGFDGHPAALSRMLSEEPPFFVDIIRRIYRPRGEDDEESGEDANTEAESEAGDEEQRAAVAQNAYRLLSDWKRVPGLRDDGTVDADQLEAWVTEAREKLAESRHSEVGDAHIGHVLAWAPADADGVRPPAAVRDLLEKLQSAEIEDGIRVELFNSRGPTSRGAFDGGDQERVVSASYLEQAEKVADRWPRTAALLRELGEGYERDARWLDEEAERRRKGFDN